MAKIGSQLTPEWRLLVGVLAAGAGLGIIWGVGKLITSPFKNLQENASQNNAGDIESPSGVAAQLNAAGHSGWLGCCEDEELIVSLAYQIPTYDFYKDVIKAYRNQTSRELEEDLVAWLSTSEYQQFKSIISQNNANNA